MNSGNFFVIFNISLTFFLINYVRSENEFKMYNKYNKSSLDLHNYEATSEPGQLCYVATTQRIVNVNR
jgi:hypothetical protein